MKNYQVELKTWKNKVFIKRLKQAFPEAEIFLVGGAVRDSLLGRKIKDVDLVIRKVSKKNLEKFLTSQGRVNLVGKKFGVFKFVPNGSKNESEIDIALPRTEHSVNFSGAYKDFKINSDEKLEIKDDLSRRDFTINAMAFDLITQKLIDPFNGQNDLNKRIIRTVGRPEQRFKEDYSRMLRAIRFSCQLGFTISPQTQTVIKNNVKNLVKKTNGENIVPFEVIAAELNKSFIVDPVTALELLDKNGVLKILIPELLKMKKCPQPVKWHAEGDVWKHTLIALKILRSPGFKKEFDEQPPSSELVWSIIFHDLGKPYTMTKTDRIRFNGHDVVSAQKFIEIANRLKIASAGVNVSDVILVIKKHMLLASSDISKIKNTTLEKYFFNPRFPGQLLLMLFFADISATIPKSGRPTFTDYKKITSRIKKLQPAQSKILPRPVVNGRDLMKNFKLAPGPKIGNLLEILREGQLSGKIKTKKQGLDYIKKYL